MSSILVLGGAGYIGSHTVYELIEAGEDVYKRQSSHRILIILLQSLLQQMNIQNIDVYKRQP